MTSAHLRVFSTLFVARRTVSKSRHKKSGNIFAIKTIKYYSSKNKKKQEGITFHVLREIRIMKSLNHENIVKLYDIVCRSCIAISPFARVLFLQYVWNSMQSLLHLQPSQRIINWGEHSFCVWVCWPWSHWTPWHD